MSTNFAAADMWITGKDATKARLHRPTCKKVNTGLAHTVQEALATKGFYTVWVSEASAASCCKPPASLVVEAVSAAQVMLDAAEGTDSDEVLEAIAALPDPYAFDDDDDANHPELWDDEVEDAALPASETGEADYSARASYDSSKAPRYFWRVMSKDVAKDVADHFGVRVETIPRSYAVWVHADSQEAATQAADALIGIWRTCAVGVKSWRKTDEGYQALPEKGSKWSTSARFRAEEDHIRQVAAGTLAVL